MKKRHAVFILILAILTISCDNKPQYNEVTKEESKVIAEQHIKQMKEYEQYKARSITQVSSTEARCPFCWKFVYEIEIERIQGFDRARSEVTVKEGEVISGTFELLEKEIKNFEDCKEGGGEIKDYYPRECATQQGIIFEEKVAPLTNTSEKGTAVANVSIRSSCIKGKPGGEVYFRLKSFFQEAEFQIKISSDEYKKIHSSAGSYEKFTPFSVCQDCPEGEFSLKPDKVYVLRVLFKNPGKVYSNEYLIDTRNESSLLEKECKEDKIIIKRW